MGHEADDLAALMKDAAYRQVLKSQIKYKLDKCQDIMDL